MTLKEKLLESLGQERKAIDAAILLINSSWSLGRIPFDEEVARETVPDAPAVPTIRHRRSERANSTPPPYPKTTRRTTDACPKCGREKLKGESGQAFGAHKRHCSGVADPQEEAPVRKAAVRASQKAPLQTRPAPKPVVGDDDPDFDPDLDEEEMPNAFSRESRRQPIPPPPVPAPSSIRIACEACGEKFNDAKSMGIHKTRVHFGR